MRRTVVQLRHNRKGRLDRKLDNRHRRLRRTVVQLSRNHNNSRNRLVHSRNKAVVSQEVAKVDHQPVKVAEKARTPRRVALKNTRPGHWLIIT